jgi:LPS export ABC transporter protein LptC
LKTSRWYRWTAIAAVVVVIVVALRTCGFGSPLTEPEVGNTEESALTLQTVTLEQPDENGKLLWRLKAKSVTYSPDNQRAELKGLNGEFFQAGETVYTVVADEGEVQQNGETLYLRGNLKATSKANELTIEGDRLKWQPKQDRLMMGDFKDDAAFSSADSDNSDSDSAKPTPAEPDTSSTAGTTANEPVSQSSGAQQSGAQQSGAQQSGAQKSKKPPIRGFNPQMEVVANLVTVANKDNRVDLSGAVAAKRKEVPWMTFASDNLTWFTERELIETKQPIKVEQFEEKAYKTVRDRVTGKTGKVDLAKNIVTLDQLVQLDLLSQPLKVESQTAVWDVTAQLVDLDKPVKIAQPERKVTASANQAQLDLEQEVIYLTGSVQANGEENKAQLNADKVTWKNGSQEIEAEGNVNYQQAAEPKVSMSGTRAVGNIEQGTVVVTGGESTEGDVVIEFVPNEP